MSAVRVQAEPWPPVVIELQGTPRGKGTVRARMIRGHVQTYTDERTRSYESQLRYAAQQVMGEAPPTAETVVVEITAGVTPPTTWSKRKIADALAGLIRPKTRPDCENYAKACDALNGIVWLDDKQIVEERVRKVYAPAPYLRVEVRLWQPAPTARPPGASAAA